MSLGGMEEYLWLLLTIRKAVECHFQDLVDGVASKLPTWRVATLDKPGCLILVQSVLCTILIHTMMALDIASKVFAKIIKLYRSFF